MWFKVFIGASKAAAKINPSDMWTMINLQDILDALQEMTGN